MSPTKQQEETYEHIMKLYDMAEGVIDVIEFGDFRNPASFVPLVEDLIEQVERSTEVLAQAYIMYVESGKELDGAEKRKVESALRKIFTSINMFRQRSEVLH